MNPAQQQSTEILSTMLEGGDEDVSAVVVSRAWSSPNYLARLVADPRGVFAEEGYHVDPEIELRVLVDEPELTHLAITRQTTDYAAVGDLVRSFFPLDGDHELRVVQSTETVRYFVVPVKPAGLSPRIAAELALLNAKPDDSTYTNTETVTNTVTVTDVGVTTTAVAQAEVGAEIVAIAVAVLS